MSDTTQPPATPPATTPPETPPADPVHAAVTAALAEQRLAHEAAMAGLQKQIDAMTAAQKAAEAAAQRASHVAAIREQLPLPAPIIDSVVLPRLEAQGEGWAADLQAAIGAYIADPANAEIVTLARQRGHSTPTLDAAGNRNASDAERNMPNLSAALQRNDLTTHDRRVIDIKREMIGSVRVVPAGRS